jgi:hypothetical protein
MRWTFILLAIAVVMLLLAGSADGHLRGGGAHAKRVALEAFQPECAGLRINHGGLPRPTIGRAFPDACLILLSPRIHDDPFIDRCSLLVHEFGHLAGRGHDAPRGNIMHPAVGVWGGCR